MDKFKNAVIAYISPAGSTRESALTLKKELESKGIEVSLFEVGRKNSFKPVKKALEKENTLFFIGSPVYVNRMLPHIPELIEFIENKKNIPVIPFVTWGCVTSGIALYDAGKKLTENNFIFSGALKIPAPHSMTWQSKEVIGDGHPDSEDKKIIKEFVEKLLSGLENGDIPKKQLKPEDVQHQPEETKLEMEKSSLAAAKNHMPEKMISEKLCTQCGICAELCPVEAIELDPYPVFKENCITCFKCVKECPEDAILCDASLMGDRIKKKQESFNEPEKTEFYLP
ncbi:MAG: EFR1 family ferrodoxin [Thermodesulfobacteriota bacterium]